MSAWEHLSSGQFRDLGWTEEDANREPVEEFPMKRVAPRHPDKVPAKLAAWSKAKSTRRLSMGDSPKRSMN